MSVGGYLCVPRIGTDDDSGGVEALLATKQ